MKLYRHNIHNSIRHYLYTTGLLKIRQHENVEVVHIHVAKTAGRSLEKWWNSITDGSCLRYDNHRGDLYLKLFNRCKPINTRVLIGHFRYIPSYRLIFPSARIAIVLRDPLERALSHYFYLSSYRNREITGNRKFKSIARDFLRKSPSIDDFFLDNHWYGNVHYYQVTLENYQYKHGDLLAHIDNLEEHLKIWCDKLKIQYKTPPHINNGYNDRYDKIISKAQRNCFKEILSTDYKIYNRLMRHINE